MTTLALLIGTAARAQTSVSAIVVSDDRYRGASLSEGHAAPQLHVAYDNPHGWYAGGFVSGARLDGVNTQQLVAYAGYAERSTSGLSWEAGASESGFLQASSYSYLELYAGVAADNFSGRLYLSPNYFGANTRTLYAELNGIYPARDNLQLLAHVGFLHPLSAGDGPAPDFISRFDSKIGISTRFAAWNAQLAWVAIERSRTQYRRYEDRNPRALVLSIGYAF